MGRGGRCIRRASSAALACVTVVAAVSIIAPAVSTRAGAAPLPGSWCGPGESAVDLPDVAAGPQIHAVYAYTSDVPDRFDFAAPRIARDLAGVDEWWRAQDPTRTPRFDFADFPCDSEFGRLDISAVALPGSSDDYNSTDRSASLTKLVADVSKQLGASGKANLIYADFPVPVIGNNSCGVTRTATTTPGTVNGTPVVFLQPPSSLCAFGGFGSGRGWPAQAAAHELMHLINGGALRGAPHACPDDAAHICEPFDILAGAATVSYSSLSQAVLDPGRDDYYGHGDPGRFDARSSTWLVHLDAPQHVVTVAAPVGGHVVSTYPGVSCPPRCSPAWDAGTPVLLSAVPDAGYAFLNWAGDCQGLLGSCALTTDEDRFALAVFAPLQSFEVRVKGPGWVDSPGSYCDDVCTWARPRGTALRLTAHADRRAQFGGWSKRCRGSDRRCVVVVKQAGNVVTATFSKQPR